MTVTFHLESSFIVLISVTIQMASAHTLCTSSETAGATTVTSHTTNVDNNEAFGYIAENFDYMFKCCGVVTEWKFYPKVTGTLQVQVWRKMSTNVYSLVGENYCTVTTANTGTTCSITERERIFVQPGDFIGWHSHGEEIMPYSFNTGNTEYPTTLFRRIMTQDFFPGDTFDWSGIKEYNDRIYAISASYTAATSPTFTNVASVDIAIDDQTASGATVHTLSHTELYDNEAIITRMASVYSEFTYDTSAKTLKTASSTFSRSSYSITFGISSTPCNVESLSTMTVTVTNTAPVITSLPAGKTLPESQTATELIHNLAVTDPTDTIRCYGNWGTTYPFMVKPISTTSYGVYVEEYPEFKYATTPSYDLSITCEETDNGQSDTESLLVTIVPNSTPVITNLDSSIAIDATTTYIGAVAFTVTSTDDEGDPLEYAISCSTSCPFQIFGTGEVLVTDWLLEMYETQVHALSVTVTDGITTSAAKTLVITISNTNHPPEFLNLPTNLDIRENIPLGTSLLTVDVFDADTSDSHTFTIFTMSSSDSKLGMYFAIDPSSGVLSTALSNLDFETDGGTYNMIISVTDGKSYASSTVTLTIQNQNEAPSFEQDYYSIQDSEGSNGHTLPDPAYTVLDPDAGDITQYSLNCGADDFRFAIDPASGQISYKGDYSLDVAGTPDEVTCTVKVEDEDGLSDTATLYIHIKTVNDMTPAFTESSYLFYVDNTALVGSFVYQVSAADTDNSTDHGTVYYSLDQSTLAKQYFMIDEYGNIYVLNTLTEFYLTGIDLVFTVKGTNPDGLEGTASVTVKVPQSTTTTTTTTDRNLMYTEMYINVVWMFPVGLVFVVLTFLVAYLLYRCETSPFKIILDTCCGELEEKERRRRIKARKPIKAIERKTNTEIPMEPAVYIEPDQPKEFFEFYQTKDGPLYESDRNKYSQDYPLSNISKAKSARSVSPQPYDSVSQVAARDGAQSSVSYGNTDKTPLLPPNKYLQNHSPIPTGNNMQHVQGSANGIFTKPNQDHDIFSERRVYGTPEIERKYRTPAAVQTILDEGVSEKYADTFNPEKNLTLEEKRLFKN